MRKGTCNYICWSYYISFSPSQFSLDCYYVGLGIEIEGITQVRLEEHRTVIRKADVQKEKATVRRKPLAFLVSASHEVTTTLLFYG